MFEGLSDRRIYSFIRDEPPDSVAALEDRYRSLCRRRSPDGQASWLNWALWCPDLECYVGYVQATIPSDHKATIAYVLFREAWGSGYAREAVAELIEYLREHEKVSEIHASVDTRNQKSMELLESLGFDRVAIHRGAEWIHGVLTDEAEYLLFVG